MEVPRDIEAEKSVIGSIMLDNEKIIEVGEVLAPSDFYNGSYSAIYKAMNKLYDNDKPVDMVTITDKLRQEEILEDVGAETVSSAVNEVPTASNAKHYAEVVKEKATQRAAIQIGQKIRDLGFEGLSANEIKEKASRLIDQLSTAEKSKIFKFGDTMKDYFEELERRYNSDDNIVGLPWPWKSINEVTGGIKSQNLHIIAARPSMGKTAVALEIIRSLAKEEIPGGLISLEMSDYELKDRIFAAETNTNGLDIARGSFGEEAWERLSRAAGDLAEIPLFTAEPDLKNLNEIKNECRKLKRKEDIQYIVVDYLQLVTGVNDNTRNLEVEQISRTFKQIARELDIPVILLAQLSRGVEQRNDKRPVLSDLRDSGSIEQDADLVSFLYRDEYYNPETEKQGIMEFIIGKQRNGPTDTVELTFLKEWQRVVDKSNRQEG